MHGKKWIENRYIPPILQVFPGFWFWPTDIVHTEGSLIRPAGPWLVPHPSCRALLRPAES